MANNHSEDFADNGNEKFSDRFEDEVGDRFEDQFANRSEDKTACSEEMEAKLRVLVHGYVVESCSPRLLNDFLKLWIYEL